MNYYDAIVDADKVDVAGIAEDDEYNEDIDEEPRSD